MEDLTGAGKIAEVIANSIGRAIGTLIEPWQVRRVGHAKAEIEAYTIEKKAEAEARAEIIRHEYVNAPMLESERTDIKVRAGQRLITQEVNRQANIESIVLEASSSAHKLEESGAESRPLDDDWINAFLEYAQNVSNNDLRHIWADILVSQATEGASTVSKATLDAIRLIEPVQAIMFERAVRLYLSMGQIMDVDPIDCVDVGYYSQMLEATALEDLGLLKRIRDVEQNLEVQGGILTFWRDVHPGKTDGDFVLWTDPSVRKDFLERIFEIARGTDRDHGKLRESIRIERQILTSRGFELASIIIPNFNSHFETERHTNAANLGDYSDTASQEKILNQWALKLSAQGAAITFSLPVKCKIPQQIAGGVKILPHNFGQEIYYDPKQIFNPEKNRWEKIKL